MNMPSLPEPAGMSDYFPIGGYTADQMRAYALKVVEECARVCEERKANWNYCAAAIRARFTSARESQS